MAEVHLVIEITTYYSVPEIVPIDWTSFTSFSTPFHWRSLRMLGRDMATHQGMVAPKRNGEFALLRMRAGNIRNFLRGRADGAWVLKYANGRVILCLNRGEFEMSVGNNGPTKRTELRRETGIDEVYGALIDTEFRLGESVRE